jgi:hypothetical protein
MKSSRTIASAGSVRDLTRKDYSRAGERLDGTRSILLSRRGGKAAGVCARAEEAEVTQSLRAGRYEGTAKHRGECNGTRERRGATRVGWIAKLRICPVVRGASP